MISVLELFWVPVVTGLIGWFTNWVAIRMLFKPREGFRLFGLKLQGVIPRRKEQLAGKIGEIVEREMLCSHTIRGELEKVDLGGYLEVVVKRMIREGLGEKLKEMPFVGSFINEDTLGRLEGMAMEALAGEMEGLKGALSGEVERHLEIKRIVEEKIGGFDLDKLERMVMEAAGNEFRVIEVLGGVLGFVVGVGQLLVLWACGNLSV